MTNIKKNKFFLSYVFCKNNSIGYGNSFIYTDKSLLSQYQIREIEQEFKKENSADSLSLINYIKIENDK
jgi:hypothetical protein